MSKFILDEGIDMPEKLDLEDFKRRKELHEAKQLKEDVPAEESLMAINSMVSSLIQSKWQAIDAINGNIAMLQQFDRPDVVAVLQNILSDNYIHIGQLEKILEMGNPDAENIEVGKENVEDTAAEASELDDIEVDVEPIEDEEVEESLAGLEYTASKIKDEPKDIEIAEIDIDDDVPMDIADNVKFKKKEAIK